MPRSQPIPLGTPIPDRPHAVSCSLPTMAAVRGYEERDPAVMAQLKTGYPRFVIHPLARRLSEVLTQRHGLGGRTLWLASSGRMAAALTSHLRASGVEAAVFEADGCHGASHPSSPALGTRAKTFLQNIGGFMSSREAEDRLHALGAGPAPSPERTWPGDPAAEANRVVGPLFPGAEPIFASCGMSAIHAAFRAVSELQAARGRTLWIQLGWLYLDTIALLKRFTPSPGDYVHIPEVTDLGPLERLLAEAGPRVAGVMAEVPTNPLVQSPDAERLAQLCRRHGVRLILDPAVSSPFSVDCLRHADMVATSLTKYAASEGDVLAGVVAVNPAGPDAAALHRGASALVEPAYARDFSRFAAQVGNAAQVLARIEESTPRVASFLESHPSVGSVHWALGAASREHYLRVARTPTATGGVVSFAVRGDLGRFYDRLALAKGPSFGMETTLICPFMYLAHYDLVTSEEGRRELFRNGIDPDLLRLCVGTEPVEGIIAALDEALEGA